ncbi:beta-lactamase family protein [bacterium]|nr:beta-lactamase family protein [bacterium]
MKFSVRSCCILLLALSLIAPGEETIQRLDGTSVSGSQLTDHVKELMRKAGVAGLALSILNENRVAYMQMFGYKNSKTGEPLSQDTIFYGASFSKAVFAYYVMQLVEKGSLQLDTPLVKYLDKPLYEYSFAKSSQGYQSLKDDDRHRKITARMCLSHTTGFPNWRWFEDDEQLRIKSEPGTKYSYSGEGLYLLQFVIEQILKQEFQQSVHTNVIEPFGMLRSSYVWEQRFESNHCQGHDHEGTPLAKKKRTAANAAGSLEMTIADYSLFLEAMLQKKGLKAESFHQMWSPQIRIRSKQQFGPLSRVQTDENDGIQLSYGLGWGLLKSPYGWAFFKEGHDEGWGHYSICFPDKKIGFVVMSNSDNGEKIFKDLLNYCIRDTFTPWFWENYIPFQEPAVQKE